MCFVWADGNERWYSLGVNDLIRSTVLQWNGDQYKQEKFSRLPQMVMKSQRILLQGKFDYIRVFSD